MQLDNFFQCGRFELSFEQPLVMGIINVTPDSFSDGGLYEFADLAINRALKLIDEGVDILDIGAESTRPGSIPISDEVEIDRLFPVLEALRVLGIPLSVDTYKPSVMKLAIDLGVDIINDVRGFTELGSLEIAARSNCGLCIMHNYWIRKIQSIQSCVKNGETGYENLLLQVQTFFKMQKDRFSYLGVNKNRMIFDPGFGFGKTTNQSFFLLKKLLSIKSSFSPILVGVSRKSMIGDATKKKDATERLPGSIAAALACVLHGANIIRVHDAAETIDALRIWKSAGCERFSYE